MAIIVTDPRGPELDETQKYHLYCTNDARVTREIFDQLHPLLADQEKFYDANMAFLSPTLAMSLRGVRVDEQAVKEALRLREAEERSAIEILRAHPQVLEVWQEREKWENKRDGFCPVSGKNHLWKPRGSGFQEQSCSRCGVARSVITPLNPHSAPQMALLLYDLLRMRRRYSRKTGEVTTDDDALEALALKYPEFSSLCDAILEAREARKQVSLLKSRRDSDGRWRSSFNVSAAETDRMSSSKSAYRTGGNLQNIADRSRNIFVPDPGLEFFYADLEQAESNVVANDAQCPQDIADHASGDTHTGLAVNIFPRLPWPGKDISENPLGFKKVASTPLPWDPEHDHRFATKVVRHGTNIGMTEVGIARELRCSRADAKKYREAYFDRYPENLARQQEIRREVRETGVLTNPLGRSRVFLGRLWEEDTMKEALAQTQQSTVAWMINIAMWRVWYELDTGLNLGQAPRPGDPNRVWLLAQVHDAILGLYRPWDTDALRRVKAILETPIRIRNSLVKIGAEILVGPTWRKKDMRVWHDNP